LRPSEKNRQPVERFAAAAGNRMDGKSALGEEPGDKDDCEGNRENDRGDPELDPEGVSEIIGDQRSENADQHNGHPVGSGHIATLTELNNQGGYQQGHHHPRRSGESKVQGCRQEICNGLTDGGGHDLDDPKEQRHFGHLVEQCATYRGGMCCHGLTVPGFSYQSAGKNSG
jgi:hypothetical protein